MQWWRQGGIRTVIDLIWLSPLLIDEDDGHQDDDLSHNAKEGPESSQATANTQVDLVGGCAKFIGSRADVVSDVTFDVQVIKGQNGLVRSTPDLIFVASAVDDWLRVMLKQQVSNKNTKTDVTNLHHFISQLKYHTHITCNI